jgi:hypothetical protein
VSTDGIGKIHAWGVSLEALFPQSVTGEHVR